MKPYKQLIEVSATKFKERNLMGLAPEWLSKNSG
jgi:hypothetical protein